jgi:hypothetical protein
MSCTQLVTSPCIHISGAVIEFSEAFEIFTATEIDGVQAGAIGEAGDVFHTGITEVNYTQLCTGL